MNGYQTLLMLYVLYTCYLFLYRLYIQRRGNRRFWLREINLDRDTTGYFVTMYPRMKETDPEQFFKHTKMNLHVYELLLSLVKDQ